MKFRNTILLSTLLAQLPTAANAQLEFIETFKMVADDVAIDKFYDNSNDVYCYVLTPRYLSWRIGNLGKSSYESNSK